MCHSQSGIAVRIDETSVRVYTCLDTDSHSDIRERCGLSDGANPMSRYQTPVELVPFRGMKRVEDFYFRFDAGRPKWWTDSMTGQAKSQMFAAFSAHWDGDVFQHAGYLNLRSLTSIPEGVTLSVGGYLSLHSLTSIPEGFRPVCREYCTLGRWHKGAN